MNNCHLLSTHMYTTQWLNAILVCGEVEYANFVWPVFSIQQLPYSRLIKREKNVALDNKTHVQNEFRVLNFSNLGYHANFSSFVTWNKMALPRLRSRTVIK